MDCTGASFTSCVFPTLFVRPGESGRYPSEAPMRHIPLLMAFFIALASPAPGDEPATNLAVNEKLRLFNPEIFGKTPSDPVTMLLSGLQGIQPEYIQVDLQDGRYSAALIT
jgi:hypothetical protein